MIQHIDSLDALRTQREAWREEGLSVAFVPTMGALHAGHLSLVTAARAAGDRVIVSIFVNPTQFAPGEDLESYPRDFEGDSKNLEAAGADAVFTTTPAEMYPDGFATWVSVEGLTGTLCGAARPDHFRGVTTVVTKLFQLVDPDDAFFGEKDRQQLTVLKRMATDLNMRVRVHGCPIVREPDGLALSSRNAYLTDEDRARGLALSRGLRRASESYAAGERNSATLAGVVREALDAAQARTDYVTAVSPLTLQPVDQADDGTFVAVAAFFGATRLIDNHVLSRPFPA